MQRLHRRLAPEVGSWSFPSAEAICDQAPQCGDIAAVWTWIDRKLAEPPPVDRYFHPPRVTTYPWLATYDRDGYIAMLSTHSAYALLDHERRKQIMAGIGRLIDEHLEGRVTKQYLCVVAIAEARAE